MDIIILTHEEIDNVTVPGDTISNFLRYYEIKNYYKAINDVYEVQKEYPEVKYRYLAIPSEKLDHGYHEIIFGNSTAFPM